MRPAQHVSKKQRDDLVEPMLAAGMPRRVIKEEMVRRWGLRPRQAWRFAHGWSLDAMAAAYNARYDVTGCAPMSASRLSAYERWPYKGERPTAHLLLNLAGLFGTTVDHVVDSDDWARLHEYDRWMIQEIINPDTQTDHAEPKKTAESTDVPAVLSPPGNEVTAPPKVLPFAPSGTMEFFPMDWDDMERRLLLQLAASFGFVSFTASGEPLRQLLDLATATGPRDIDDWELACSDHLYAVRTRPPAQIQQDLAIDLLALQRQIQGIGGGAELNRVAAALSTLYANVLTRLGEHGAAIRWWRTARQAADKSGDLELSLSIRATEAGHGLFGQRSPESVLHLTQKAQEIAGNSPSLGLALVLCSHAKALSALERHSEAQDALDACRNLVTVPRAAGIIMPSYWDGGLEMQLKLHAAERQVFSRAGNQSATSRAVEHVLVLANGDYQILPSVKLDEALCVVTNGGIDQGIRDAAAVIAALPIAQRSAMTLAYGYRVLHAVPVEARDREPVREFREVLALASAPQGRPEGVSGDVSAQSQGVT